MIFTALQRPDRKKRPFLSGNRLFLISHAFFTAVQSLNILLVEVALSNLSQTYEPPVRP